MIKLIYILDDDDIFQLILQHQLAKRVDKLNIEFFKNGGQALIKLQSLNTEEYPQIIIVDLHMPVKNGFEFLEDYSLLEKRNKKSKIIVVSSSMRQEDKARALEAPGTIEYFVKPLSNNDFSRLVEIIGSEQPQEGN